LLTKLVWALFLLKFLLTLLALLALLETLIGWYTYCGGSGLERVEKSSLSLYLSLSTSMSCRSGLDLDLFLLECTICLLNSGLFTGRLTNSFFLLTDSFLTSTLIYFWFPSLSSFWYVTGSRVLNAFSLRVCSRIVLSALSILFTLFFLKLEGLRFYELSSFISLWMWLSSMLYPSNKSLLGILSVSKFLTSFFCSDFVFKPAPLKSLCCSCSIYSRWLSFFWFKMCNLFPTSLSFK